MKFILATFLIFVNILCITGRSVASNLNLPDLGDSGAAAVTLAQEKRTGEAVMHNLRRAGLIVDDPLLTEYLNQLGYQLVSQYESENPNDFTFFLVNDRDINAFALPGGYIGINYGLIMASESESELASVLAHEIAHVTQRHYARAYDIGPQSNLPVIAAIIAAIILGSQGSELGEAAMATAAAATAQHQINFTRHNEEEADRIGIQLLARAGFDAEKMADFFDKLDKQARLYGIDIPEFLRTHPVNTSRITDARNRARLLAKPKPSDVTRYHLMRNRVIALASEDTKHAESDFSEKLKTQNTTNRNALEYGYILTLMQNGKYQQAQQHINPLLKSDPHRIAYLLAAAEIHHQSGHHKKAYQTYQRALTLYPANMAITHDYVELLLKDQKYKQAKSILEEFVKTPPANPKFYKFLAESRNNLGDKSGSHEAMAEYYYQIGQLHQAIDQINLALKDKKLDFYTTSRLEARLAHVKQEVPLPTK